jgi:hypothetical protein
VLRCAYVDLDHALLGRGGSLLHDADGRFSLLGLRAFEACERAGAEVVIHSARPREGVEPIAELLGVRAWIAGAGDVLMLDGEELAPGDLEEAIAQHMRARDCPPADALAVGPDLGPAAVVGTLWLVGGQPAEDPLLGLELDRHPNVRMTETGGGPAAYEAVVTTLAEGRA